ncbi:septal ring lytic transglycosylase RlpA family protein [Vibrio sp.]|uniref:Endolytic peptidoglycan transglycosylase RlpA n=1 Tax=Vibrio viridaestus TaxID=2487322 RepID=A0A3N9TE09_9VIBR|nr:septal ring lytic transglycosylase RlpA family protein [Vibrio viridaestus]MDC0611579.1 septal ring lytic transglycosylase RlpA family protein [Vibrio sp.]RQW62457.1 septal ring lytic transglycosylase RlpA family protein [Vibrio viridaestus]
MNIKHLLSCCFVVTIIAGCSSSGRYDIDDDVAPDTPISVDHIEDASPKYEPYSTGGNRDYTVLGQSYKVMKTTSGFKQRGKASWYGKKFHGHRTSNGEVYDMYSMTAAHKTLPIPSYAKVTNLDNGKTAIVRINDRGPFHSGRIIDLSYAAAYKLGVVQTGTANVEVEAITTQKVSDSDNKKPINGYIIQVSSSKYSNSSRTLSNELSQKLSVASFVDNSDGLHKVFLGPFQDYSHTEETLEQVKSLGYQTAFIKKHIASQ